MSTILLTTTIVTYLISLVSCAFTKVNNETEITIKKKLLIILNFIFICYGQKLSLNVVLIQTVIKKINRNYFMNSAEGNFRKAALISKLFYNLIYFVLY